MKVLLSAFAVLFGLSSYAGPEDHLPYQTCYSLSEGFTAAYAADVPPQVCLETLAINRSDKSVSVFSYVQPKLFSGLQVTQLVQQKEDRYAFAAQSVLSRKWDSACGAGAVETLKVSGFTDALGEANLQALTIVIERVKVADTCHPQPQVQTFTYVK
jgi:hypothetical protein